MIIKGRYYTFLLWLVLINCQVAFAAPEHIYLFRHSEKQAGENPYLTDKGQARADHLVSILKAHPHITLYSSNYNRTKSTAAPLAEHFNINPHIYNASDLATLKNQLLNHQGVVVVIGHSNTTPQLASLLSEQTIETMDEKDFSHFYLVSKLKEGGYKANMLTMDF